MQRGRLLIKRIVAMVMSIVLTLSLLLGCNFRKDSQVGISLSETDIDKIVETTSGKILDELNTQPTVDEINASSEEIFISNNWEDYIGDIETFVYGLITNELQYKYDVFPAYVELADGVYVSGIAYTDYSECYTNEDESHCYFTAGLLPFYGEVEISDEDFNSGLILYNMDYTDENTSFILTYLSDEFTEHCIVYGQYLKYGVNEIGQVTYQAEEYVKGQCDESLGALYSYDEGRYVFDDGSGDYVLLSGISLYSQIDYEELEKEINAVLETQDVNFADVDVKSYAYIAQEAVTSYLLSMQDETFLGYNVNELVQMAETLDPLQCLRITNEGIAVVDIEAAPAEGGEAIVKWLVGTSCVIVTAVGLVGSIVFIECPALSACAGAITGVAIEIFMEVVISEKNLCDVSWEQVALSATTGAISGYLGPFITATTGGFSGFLIDSAIDGLLGGIEHAALAWLNGGDGKAIVSSFGYGLALGFVLSAGFKGVTKSVEKLVKAIVPVMSKLSKKVFPNLTKKSGDFVQVVLGVKKKIDGTVFHSEYIAKSMRDNVLNAGADTLKRSSYKQLSRENIVDKNGNSITKERLISLFDEAEDNTILAYYKIGEEMVTIKKQNNIFSLYYEGYQAVTLDDMVANREANFVNSATKFKEDWMKDPSKIPTSIAEGIKNSNITLEEMSPQKLKTIIQKSDMVLHEEADLKTVRLVSRVLHDKMEGQGLGHMGGYALAKYYKNNVGVKYFERFVQAASSGFVKVAS